MEYFPFISETAVNELVNYLKQYETSVYIYVNDSMTGGEIGYTINAKSKNKKVVVTIKSENLDDDWGSSEVKLVYQ